MVTTMPPPLVSPSRSRLPATLPRGRTALVTPLLLAVGLGLAAAFWPLPTLVATLGVLVGAILLVRLDWAVFAVVTGAVFSDWLALVNPYAGPGLIVVLVGAWVVRRSRGRLHVRPPSQVLLAAGAFLVVLVLATLVHPNGPSGLDTVTRYVGLLAVLVVLVDCLQSFLTPRRLMRAYVVACSAAAACGLLNYLFSEARRVVGPVSDPNALALFLLAAVPLAFALRGRARSPWLYDAAQVLLLVAIVGTLSRAALVGLVAMVLFALTARMISARFAAAIVILVGTGIAFLLAAFPQVVEVSLAQRQDVAEQGVARRLDLWQAAGGMTRDHPVLGLGPGGYALHEVDYRQDLAGGTGGGTDSLAASGELLAGTTGRASDLARSTYLDASAELGVLGLLGLLAVWGAALHASWARWRRDGSPLAAGVASALVATLVASAFVTSQYALPLWLLAALGAACAPLRERPAMPVSLTRLRGDRDPGEPG